MASQPKRRLTELDREAGKARSGGCAAGGRGMEARQHDDIGDDQHQVGLKRCKRIRHRYVLKTERKMAEHAQKTLMLRRRIPVFDQQSLGVFGRIQEAAC